MAQEHKDDGGLVTFVLGMADPGAEVMLPGGETAYEVTAITDCPHVQAGGVISDTPRDDESAGCTTIAGMTCNTCAVAGDAMVCCNCEAVHCSRYTAGHASVHADESGHAVVLCIADMSMWCYSCDAYLDTFNIPLLHPIFRKYYRMKFGEEPELPVHAVRDVPGRDACGAGAGAPTT